MTPEERWKEIAAGPEADIDLVEGALLIAAHEYPGLDIRAYQARMDRIAATLKGRLCRDSRSACWRPRAGGTSLRACCAT